MKLFPCMSGLLAGLALLIAPRAWAVSECDLAGALASEPSSQVQATAPKDEVVVIVTESAEAGSRMEITVTGAAGQSVRVEAPSNYKVTAIGGAGAAGAPGAPGK